MTNTSQKDIHQIKLHRNEGSSLYKDSRGMAALCADVLQREFEFDPQADLILQWSTEPFKGSHEYKIRWPAGGFPILIKPDTVFTDRTDQYLKNRGLNSSNTSIFVVLWEVLT